MPRLIPLSLALAAALPLSAPAPAEARRLGSLDFVPCALEGRGSLPAIEAQCATLAVPEDRAAPEGRQIALAIERRTPGQAVEVPLTACPAS